MQKRILIATVIVQFFLGITQIFAAGLLLDERNMVGLAISQIYGLLMLIIAGVTLAILFTHKLKSHLLAGFITLFIFHLGLGVSQVFALTRDYGHVVFPVVNLVFAVIFMVLIIKDVKKY